MLRKGLIFAAVAALVAAVAGQRQDIARYIKIKQMSAGNGHPELVPAGGSTAYPQHSTKTGQEQSLLRGD
jgi:hypothetical protein